MIHKAHTRALCSLYNVFRGAGALETRAESGRSAAAAASTAAAVAWQRTAFMHLEFTYYTLFTKRASWKSLLGLKREISVFPNRVAPRATRKSRAVLNLCDSASTSFFFSESTSFSLDFVLNFSFKISQYSKGFCFGFWKNGQRIW